MDNNLRSRHRLLNITPLLAALTMLAVILVFPSCSKDTGPDQIVAAFVNKCRSFAAEGEGRSLRKMISPDYLDAKGRTKKDLANIVTYYLLRNKKVHSLYYIDSVSQIKRHQVKATLLMALSGHPISDVSMIPALHADIYWFDIEITEKDGDWQLFSADWRLAMVDDFLNHKTNQ